MAEKRFKAIYEEVAPTAIPPCAFVRPDADGRGEPCGRRATGFVERVHQTATFRMYCCPVHSLAASTQGPGTVVALGVLRVVCDACARERGGRCTH